MLPRVLCVAVALPDCCNKVNCGDHLARNNFNLKTEMKENSLREMRTQILYKLCLLLKFINDTAHRLTIWQI